MLKFVSRFLTFSSTSVQKLSMFNIWIHVGSSTYRALHVDSVIETLNHTFELIEREFLIHAEVWMIDDVVENGPAWLSVGIEQRLRRDSVRQQKYDAQQHEEHQILYLHTRHASKSSLGRPER